MLSIKTQSNYLAKVVSLKGLRKHSNADRLQCVAIDGNNVITGANLKDGDIVVYFPLECQINKEYLSFSNSFEDKELNADTNIKSFFPSTGRVRCLKLRNEPSEGYIVPIESIHSWLKSKGLNYSLESSINVEFDTICGIELCRKYVVQNQRQSNESPIKKSKLGNKVKREKRLIDGQFKMSDDTCPLAKNLHRLTPDTHITISYKMHGANGSMGKVLVNKKLKWWEKILQKIGVNIVDREYGLVYASRRIIKNSFQDQTIGNDVWGIVAGRYKDSLLDGITLHGEVVGFDRSGKGVQKNYDYGQEPNTCEFYVYRIYYTNPSGKTFEFSTSQIKEYCNKFGLKMVPVFYDGLVKNLYPDLVFENDEQWNRDLFERLKKDYTEKTCYMCKNKVPEEGIVITLNTENKFEPFKLKSFLFKQYETKQLDTGEVSMEDE